MAVDTGYYRYDAGAPIKQGGTTVATPGESKFFDEWAALLYPGEAYKLVDDIDNKGYFSLQSSPLVGSDGLLLVSPADTTRATLNSKLNIVGGTKSILNPGANEILQLNVSAAIGSPACIFYLSTAGTQTLPTDGSTEPIAFPVANITNAFVTPNGAFTQWTAAAAGIFHINAGFTVESGTSQVRKRILASVDTGGGFNALAGTTRYSSNPDGFNDENTSETTFPWVAGIGDVLRIDGGTDGGTVAATLRTDGCWLYIRST